MKREMNKGKNQLSRQRDDEKGEAWVKGTTVFAPL